MKFMAILLFLTCIVYSEDDDMGMLSKAKTIKCYLEKGSAANWDNNKVNIEILKSGNELVFDNINLTNKTCRLIGNQGSSDVNVYFTGIGLTFIEITSAGSVITTTVFYSKKLPNNSFSCVHSRHVDLMTPYPSQYYGYGKILETNP